MVEITETFLQWHYTAKKDWLFIPLSGCPGCRQTEVAVVM